MRRTALLAALALVAGLAPLALAPTATADALVARGSVNQVQVTGATPGAGLELRHEGATVATGTADARGAFIFGVQYGTTDDVPTGTGYTVRVAGGGSESAPVTVTAPADDPPQSFYLDQTLPYGLAEAGYGYVTTRDGTQLAIHSQPPAVDLNGPAPDPILVNYSGYTPANPAATDPEPTLLAARLLGYGTVGVNMRGTGCSGGAFAFFEPLQSTDGYDVIEAVAAQSWSGDVGMFGISYPGISQLFVAATQPPHLTAITPLSVIADTYRSTLYPGGILNNGFAVSWADERAHDSRPAPDGQPWTNDRIANGDTTCEANQVLHGQAPSIGDQLTQDKPYDPTWFDQLAPRAFVDRIDVPVFLGGAWQDEQTGGHFPTMLDELATNVPDLHVALTNGTHVESLGPDLLVSVFEFLDFYVAHRRPLINPAARPAAPALYEEIFGEPYNVAADRSWPLDYDVALARYQAEPDIRVLWERGARGREALVCALDLTPGPDCSPRTPLARYETTYAAWPPPEATATRFFLAPDGRLQAGAPTVADDEPRGHSSYEYDAAAVARVTTFAGDTAGIWRTDADITWPQVPDGQGVSFTTDPLGANLALLGTSSAQLWLRSTAPDVDLEVTLSEVRPDGQETYVQSGVLRASHRREGPGSTALDPFHTHLATDAAPLPAGEFTPVRVEIMPVAHVVRAGSRLRLTVEAPGGNRPFWTYDSIVAAGAINDIAHSAAHPSSLTLSTVPDPGTPVVLPACESLRGQPCRAFTGLRSPTGVTAAVDADGRSVHVAWTPPQEGGAVTGYRVTELPSGETFSVPGGATSYERELPAGLPPTPRLAYTVTARFAGGDGPPSSPSLEVPPPSTFTDVAPGAGYAAAVDWLAGWRIATGSQGRFRPADPLTRQQLAQWLWVAMGRPATTGHHRFADVRNGTPLDAALDWAVGQGIVEGISGRRFRPQSAVTRAQLATWLWNLAGSPTPSGTSPFRDVPRNAWYANGVTWLAEQDVVATSGTFRPATAAKRSQLASWLFALAPLVPAP